MPAPVPTAPVPAAIILRVVELLLLPGVSSGRIAPLLSAPWFLHRFTPDVFNLRVTGRQSVGLLPSVPA
jgi:hypothetical protein